MKAVLESVTVSEDEIYNEKMLLVLCAGNGASRLWLKTT